MLGSFFGRLFGSQVVDKVLEQESVKEINYNQQFEFELRPAMIVTRIGFITSWLLIIASIVLLVVMKDTLNSDSMIGIGILLAGGILFLVMTIDNTMKYVKLSNSRIESNSVFQKKLEIRWDDVTNVVFRERKQVELHSSNGKVVVFRAFKGSNVVLRMVYDKVDVKKYYVFLLNNEYYLAQFLNNLNEQEIEQLQSDIKRLMK